MRTADGHTISILNGSDTQPILVTLPPGATTYEIEVRPVDPTAQGNVQISLSVAGAPETPEATPPPVTATPVPAPATTEEAGAACLATNASNNNIHVRSGPGTTFDVVGTLPPGAESPVVGVNSPAGWYLLQLPENIQGWVFGDLLMFSGDCTQLDEVAPGVQPTATSAANITATPTATTQQSVVATLTPTTAQQQPTATWTYTPTATQPLPTATYTPSYTPTTPPAAQVAPEDARFNNPLTIPLDNTASVLDFVSYPGGDREDRVRYSVTGMNPNAALSGGRAQLVISASCFGENTDQIQFFTGGNTYGCGDTLVDREVTADSDTGSVVITAVGGEGTYVQWVLTGTATRSN